MESGNIKNYFDRVATDYDSVYNGKANPINYILNRMFRREITQRYDFVFREMTQFKGKRILDVGCGSGRFAVGAMLRGAAHVTGIDLSDEMIKIAGEVAAQNKVDEKCKFIQGDFLKHNFSNNFDVTFAIGVVEFTSNPTAVLRRIFRLTKGTVFFSFPEEWAWGNFLEKFPQFRVDCPRHFYTESSITDLMGIAGFEIKKIEKKTHQFLVEASPRVRQKGTYR